MVVPPPPTPPAQRPAMVEADSGFGIRGHSFPWRFDVRVAGIGDARRSCSLQLQVRARDFSAKRFPPDPI